MQDVDLKKLKSLIKLMKKEGVLSFKTPTVEFQLSLNAVTPKTRSKRSTKDFIPVENHFTDDDLLLWSSPNIPGEQ